MKLEFSSKAKKALAAMDMNTGGRIFKTLLLLPDKGDIKPLEGAIASSFRLRVGDWRVLYSIVDDTILIEKIEPRGGVYK
ncbi:hypothetical protein FACS1894202_06070 [Clostridia bacterium]|nr:hypothetical protein FACS1894202_06070 [Clostridia bacterium]